MVDARFPPPPVRRNKSDPTATPKLLGAAKALSSQRRSNRVVAEESAFIENDDADVDDDKATADADDLLVNSPLIKRSKNMCDVARQLVAWFEREEQNDMRRDILMFKVSANVYFCNLLSHRRSASTRSTRGSIE